MRKMDGHEKVKLVLAILVILVGWGIISSFDKNPIASFLMLLVVVGGPVCFMYVLAWFPETRLGKVCQDILTFRAMFGGGGRG
jgi:nucleoside recognition membrane protein YjiH